MFPSASKKESYFLFWKKVQTKVIPPEQIQQNIDLSKVVKNFSTHKHHLGACPTTNEQPTPTPDMQWTPSVEYTSHVVREVYLTEDGGLSVTFDFMHTPRGHLFMYEYYEHDDFKMCQYLTKSS